MIVVLLGACALAAWLVSPNRRHLAAIGAAALGVASVVAVIPALTYSYPPQRWRVYAFDRNTGRALWNTDAVTNAHLTVGSDVYAADDSMHLVALDPATGTVRWRSLLKLSFGQPERLGDLMVASVVNGGIVAFTTVDGQLHGSDDRTGTERWRVPIPSSPSQSVPAPPGRSILSASSPLRTQHNGVVCLEPAPTPGGPGRGLVSTIAFDMQTGQTTDYRPCLAVDATGLLPVDGGPIVRLHAGQTSQLPFGAYDSPCGGKRHSGEMLGLQAHGTTVFVDGTCVAAYDSATGTKHWSVTAAVPGHTRTRSAGGEFVDVTITPTSVLVVASPTEKPYLGGE